MRFDRWLATPDERAPVEMEMIVVGGIEIRAERDAKIAAGAAVDRLQELAFRIFPFPVPREPDSPPVGQVEAGDVDCVGRCVLTAK